MHTIAAPASGTVKAGISVIRLSGEDSAKIAEKVFVPFSGSKSVSDFESRKQVYGKIIGSDGKKIDTGLCTYFRSPMSYTGEDVVEISCHGSPVGVSLILEALFEAGAKPAMPGEFTKRAFVNGKMDLTMAEAVGQLIDAESGTQVKLFSAQLDGSIGRLVAKETERIKLLLSSVYAYIDYPDEDMRDISDDEMMETLIDIKKNLESLTKTYSSGVAITSGVSTAIIGSPNAGKSSLLNALLGYDRAIVTDVAGTTRDVVTESVELGNIKLNLSDTAGIRQTDDTVEKIGVERSVGALLDSKLVLCVFDVTLPKEEVDKEILSSILKVKDEKNIIIVLNKCDVGKWEDYVKYFEDLGFENIVNVSAKKKEGLERLSDAVNSLYPDARLAESGLVLTNARQYAALSSAVKYTESAMSALDNLTPDTACLDMEAALGALLEADGRSVSEEIVNGIFAHFCVGK